MFQQCPHCKSTNLSLLYKPVLCIHCRLAVCNGCFDASTNRCRRCAPDPPRPGCSRCGTAVVDQTRCSTCQSLVCSNCVAYSTGNRIVCNGCPRPQEANSYQTASQAPAQFFCGRCRCPQQREAGYPPAHAEYCFGCARIICAGCTEGSLINGSFLCNHCCPYIQFDTIFPKAPPILRATQAPPQPTPHPQQPTFSNYATPAPAAAQPIAQPPQPQQPTFSTYTTPASAAAQPLAQTAASAASPKTSTVSVVLSSGVTIQMATDPTSLMRTFGLRLHQRVQCYLEDSEHPIPASVVGYTRSDVVITVESPTGQRWVAVDPGFLIRDVPQAQLSPTTPNASLSSTSSTALGYPQAQAWNFTSREYLAQGAQGQVHKCVTSDGRTVVTKEMKFALSDMASFQRQLEQARQIKHLRHNHLIQYLDVLESVDQSAATVTIITPFYNERDLREFVQRQELTIDEQHIASLILQVAGALEYLHTRNPPLVHRDVKPENILMCSNGEQALLMDLDTCKPANRAVTVGMGTMEYMSPEASGGAATTKSDIWSLGVVMYVLSALPEFVTLPKNGVELFLNESSWTDGEMRRAIILAIGRRSRSYSKTFVELVLKMLRRDPNQRPSAAEVTAELTLILENILLGQVVPMNWEL